MSNIFLLLAIGIFTGLTTGLTGASGVMVVVPLVTMILKFSIHEAIGTSLMVDIIAPLAISLTYYKHGNIDIKSGIWIAIGSIVGAQLGTLLASYVPSVGLSGAFGIFMILMAIVIWRTGLHNESIAKAMQKVFKFETKRQRIITALILGVIVGIMTGIIGAGGGGMILLILIFVLNFPLHVAIGTSALIMSITACSGAIGYGLRGNIRLADGLVLGFGAALSGMVSAKFANKVNEKVLSKIVAVIFVILAIIMTIVKYI
ncbi:MAG TPA: sulfite exporter TauE/SafE family protein [Exilispira sp.]|nr:sulfite exporter TauE/SafE family protein [Exilispira sp.]HQQ19373.1 sulfite exporter TauE/SafE family protein [Exilispira sp.]